MSGSQNVFFGGLPLNVAISAPVLNGGVSPSVGGGCGAPSPSPSPSDACGCVVPAGNGIGNIHQGQNPFPVVALQALAAFGAVVFGAGGVRNADVGVPSDRDIVVGVVTNSPLAGQLATVAFAGPVVNTVLGTGGWNFVVNEPVYIGADGKLTQTPPSTGWIKAVGFAIASNSIMLQLGEQSGSDAGNPPEVTVVPSSATLLIDHDSADTFDITVTADTSLEFTGGVDARTVMLRIKQNSVGGYVLTPTSAQMLGTVINLPTTPNAYVVARVMFDGATGKYVVIGFQVIAQ